jgi:hypothetical protein
MPSRRSVLPDPELSQDARGEPVRVPLTGSGKLDDPTRDKFCLLISRTRGKLKLGARSVERPAHGFNVVGLESESMASGFWHRGVACVERNAVLRHKPKLR